VAVGLSPGDSPELATPQLMRFYVKGGPHSNGQHGYIVSNANWDPYPMANRIEAFLIALGNMDVAVMLRAERFRNPFFTGARLTDVLPEASRGFTDYAPVGRWLRPSTFWGSTFSRERCGWTRASGRLPSARSGRPPPRRGLHFDTRCR
jgi:hypothetical protein